MARRAHEVGGSRVQTWEALKALNDHATGELEFLITSGQRGHSTALPLTDAQRAKQQTARSKQAIADAASSNRSCL